MDDQFETLAKESDLYLDDAGFTERVLARLPVRRDRPRLRAAVLLSASAIAGVVALGLLPGGEALSRLAMEWFRYRPLTDPLPLGALAVVAATLVMSVRAVASE